MTSFDRREFIKAAGAGVAVSAAAGRAAASHADQFETIRTEVVDPYVTDPEAATADGFTIGGPYVPEMGWHFLNQDNVNEATLLGIDITKPQVLVYVDERFVPESIRKQYEFDEETGLRLGAVEYAIPVGTRGHTEDNPPDVFDDEHDDDLKTTEADGWHVHPKAEHTFLTDDGQATAFDSDGHNHHYWEERLDLGNWLELVPGGTPARPEMAAGESVVAHLAGDGLLETKTVVSSSVHPDLLTLHVWLGIKNPDGVFDGHNHAIHAGSDGGHDH